MKIKLVLTACLLVAACGKGDNEPGPGGVTVGEARALDEAAQMIEERRLSPEDLRRRAAPVTAPAEQETGGG
ncbi:MAG: hypothetical protein KUG65_10900 [Sphingomonadaceae bacterium]|nr:hypothetical protein [Sphingomonadaceae bacterium]